MQRTDGVLFRSIFSGLVAASIILASGCDIGGSGSSAYLISQRAFPYTEEAQQFVVPAGVTRTSQPKTSISAMCNRSESIQEARAERGDSVLISPCDMSDDNSRNTYEKTS